jgi:hypothetical protein
LGLADDAAPLRRAGEDRQRAGEAAGVNVAVQVRTT